MAEDQNSTIKTTVELDVTSVQQKIVKLNAAASDSTKSLEERVAAKNKQVKLQEQLSKKTISDLEKEIKALEKVEGSEKKVAQLTKKLNSEKVKATKISENNTKAVKKLSTAYKDSKDSVKNLDKATGGLLGKMKAFINNPIGLAIIALVGAFQLLKTALASSEEGQNKMAKISAVLGSVFDNLIDVISTLANALVDAFLSPQETLDKLSKAIEENVTNRFNGLLELIPQLGKAIGKLFSGDFSGAAETAGNAVAKVTLGVENLSESIRETASELKKFQDEVERDAKAAASIADKRATAEKLQRDLIVEKAKAERDIIKLRGDAIRKDLFTDAQRKAALEEALEISNKIINQEIEAAKLLSAAKIEENTLANSNIEALREEEELKANLIRLETKKFNLQKRLGAELSAINEKARTDAEKVIVADEKAKADQDKAKDKNEKDKAAKKEEQRLADIEAQNEIDELDLERRRSLGENILNDELAFLERKFQQDIAAADLTAKEIEAITKKHNAAKEDLRDADAEAEKEINRILVDDALSAAADSFGIAQEVAIAKMLIKAPDAITDVWTEAAKKPTIPQVIAHGVIGTATVIAPITKGLSDIKKAKFSGSKGGGSGGSISSSSSAGSTSSLLDNASANSSSNLGVDSNVSSRAIADANNNVDGATSSNVVFSESRYDDFNQQVAFVEEKTTI